MTRSARAAAALLPVVLLAGCGFEGAQSFPLPGGTGTGDDAYEVTLEFEDVLDLVPQSAVKVDDVTVGSVSDIELRDFTAIVTVTIQPDVVLPGNATAGLRQTSLLGEKFVSLERPADGAVGQLRDGDLIGLERTRRNAEIEEVLGALSLVLNGGGLEQLQTINRELVDALEGREDEVRNLLRQLETFVGGLDDQKQDIVRALDSLDRLTQTLTAQRGTIATALEDLPDGARILADQREQLTSLVTGLDELGTVATRVITATQQNTVADLRALEPVLQQLNAAGTSLPNALELLTTYPFPKTIDNGIKGDYANLFVSLDLDLTSCNPLPDGIPNPLALLNPECPAPAAPALPGPLDGLPLPEAPTSAGGPAAPALPVLPGLPTPPLQIPGLDLPSLLGGGAGGTTSGPTPPPRQSLVDLLLGGMQ